MGMPQTLNLAAGPPQVSCQSDGLQPSVPAWSQGSLIVELYGFGGFGSRVSGSLLDTSLQFLL